ncbi:MAG TPA: J domain-containing protein [Candidatus Baltobacteraceae bacterium]|jgi:hypothetical protein|nr:J domain-containing protein [Candidatus Baltobacteraceae bacterium]
MKSVGFTYYDILGVSSSATPEEIKAAYRAAVLRYHPDVNAAADAQSLTEALNDAYAVLSDGRRRQQYDSVTVAEGLYDDADDATQSTWYLYSCDRCGLIDARLRYAVFFRVRSFFISTQLKSEAGVLCSGCRGTLAVQTLLYSIAFGPWSVRSGLAYTLRSVLAAVCGGETPRAENAELLRRHGLAYLQRRLLDEAKTALTASQRFERSDTVALLLADAEIFGVN